METTTVKHIKTLKSNTLASMKKFKWKTALDNMKTIVEIKTSSVKVETFLKISKQLSGEKKVTEAIEVLNEGLQKYPDNEEIRNELAVLASKEKKGSQASAPLAGALQSSDVQYTAEDYAKLGKSLRLENKLEEAGQTLAAGLALFPKDKAILAELAEKEMAEKNWKNASEIWSDIISLYASKAPAAAFIRQSVVQRRLKSFKNSEAVLLQGLSYYPEHAKLHREFAQSAILQRNWDEAIRRLEPIAEQFKGQAQMRSKLDLGIIHEIQGNSESSEKYYKECYEENPEETQSLYPLGYRKIVLFDNGESRIEYYKKLSKAEKLCITYDSINIVWSRSSFGFGFLKKQDIDIIAVRRRKSTSYQQDLSLEDFYASVHRLTPKYKKTVSYGFSLGGYSALYYGSGISDQVLAISPRNPGHPVYGLKHDRPVEFNHPLSHKLNADASPFIIYDPKNIIDSAYVEKDLLPSYPNAQLIKFPFVGHSTANYFSEIGVLKQVILGVLNDGEFPEIDQSQRGQSPVYLNSLARFCLRRNKPHWALKLINRSLEIKPEEATSKALKTKITAKLADAKTPE